MFAEMPIYGTKLLTITHFSDDVSNRKGGERETEEERDARHMPDGENRFLSFRFLACWKDVFWKRVGRGVERERERDGGAPSEGKACSDMGMCIPVLALPHGGDSEDASVP